MERQLQVSLWDITRISDVNFNEISEEHTQRTFSFSLSYWNLALISSVADEASFNLCLLLLDYKATRIKWDPCSKAASSNFSFQCKHIQIGQIVLFFSSLWRKIWEDTWMLSEVNVFRCSLVQLLSLSFAFGKLLWIRGTVIIRTKGQKCLLCVMGPASGISGGPRHNSVHDDCSSIFLSMHDSAV